ncbi:molybdenum cofactor sulfurase isoform X2 [Heteronotia binoei]|uniref:molybdenum cofactor sulfurase isoform X2 n=1 Tax=Heteronotia binoei TaxID=13085 RepID=UPI00293007B5|nr:molybdenum cofactor sulfurase isoform X2 [Heteronotia binoei]
MEPWREALSFAAFRSRLPPGAAYGYGGKESPRALRRSDFARLAGMTYLDHAGTTLFPQSLLKAFSEDLSANVYGNPHSQSISSKLTYDTIEHVRYRLLQHFNTTVEDYTAIFTSGCTAALKLVAEAFPWVPGSPEEPGSRFCYLTDSHTSVVGMRAITAAMNVSSVPVKPAEMVLRTKEVAAEGLSCQTPHLFCYPAQSNFSGRKYPLAWIEEIKSGRLRPIEVSGKWFVLLDAASYVSTSPLDLNVHQADFVPVSFYKMFGFPTGLGALLVKNEIASCLRKTYFGGGTAAAYFAGKDFYSPRRSIAERFEDGTVSFLDIIALKHGFDSLERLTGGMENIKQHTFALAHYTYTVLSALKYANGAPVVLIYSDTDFSSADTQGPIINFNVLDENGEIVGYSQVDRLAGLYNIHVRTGCFCNTGACQQHLGISDEDIKKNLQAGHVCGDDIDVIDGRPTGSVRISFGYMSTFEDAQTFLKFIITTRLCGCNILNCPSQEETVSPVTASPKENGYNHDNNIVDKLPLKRIITDSQLNTSSPLEVASICPQLAEGHSERSEIEISGNSAGVQHIGRMPVTVTNIYLYPIKSCAAFEVAEWPVGNQGLLYDRSWMVVNQNGVCITQKQEPRLCFVQPMIDLEKKVMTIKAEGMDLISVSLEEDGGTPAPICQSKVCSHRVQTYSCGGRLAAWFSEFLGRQCYLIRQCSDSQRNAKQKHEKAVMAASLSLVNEAQYLLINQTSVLQLSDQITSRLGESLPLQKLIHRFRANIVISTNEPFEEDKWDEIAVGSLRFKVMGPCHRCLVICIDQQTGQRNKEFLQTLASTKDRKTNFGIYLMNHPERPFPIPSTLSVGSQVLAAEKKITHSLSPEEQQSG